MNNSIFKNSKIRFFSLTLAFVSVISLGIFTQSCSKDDEPLDEAILNSSELEEYIIAGADFERSLTVFTEELNKIDFSQLEVTYDSEGKKAIHLPAEFVGSFRIEEKIQMFNEKKESLKKKFPQFISFTEDVGKKYFQQCIENSVNVREKFLEFGINSSRPLLKNGNEITVDYFSNMSYMQGQLYSWLWNPFFVEVIIIGFQDGTYAIAQNSAATAYDTPVEGFTRGVSTGNIYFQGNQSKPVAWMGHTHSYNGYYQNNPSPADQATRDNWWGINHYIYYDGTFYQY